jgi:SAM-dependent methyltransferase
MKKAPAPEARPIDEVARYNRERWNELARRGILYGRPWLDLTPEIALERVDPEKVLRGEPLAGKSVLCLAGGGGQQSAAFALLGARVVVLDLSEAQLATDRETAARYGIDVRTLQGDMRDLGAFPAASFDVVWHAHSLNFVPDPRPVFAEVARVLRPGGRYRMSYSNPFCHGMDREHAEGGCYRLCLPYADGAEIVLADPAWTFADASGQRQSVVGPREFRHTLGTVINVPASLGMQALGLWEDTGSGGEGEPGTWEHSQRIAPQFLSLWYRRA